MKSMQPAGPMGKGSGQRPREPMADAVGAAGRLGSRGIGPGEAAVVEDASPSLSLRLGASRQLALAFGVLYAGGAACLAYTDVPMALRVPAAVLVLIAGARCLACHALPRAAHAIVLVLWDRQGQWRLLQRNGVLLDAWLEHGAYSHPALLVLPLRVRGGRRVRVLVVPDRVAGDDFRRFRVRLRCGPNRSPRSSAGDC